MRLVKCRSDAGRWSWEVWWATALFYAASWKARPGRGANAAKNLGAEARASFWLQVWDTTLFPRWQSLTSLVLSGCGLAVLPTMVGRLTGLRELWLSQNRIAALPHELGALKRLHTLKADDNLLTALPGAPAKHKSIGALAQLLS